MRSLFLTAAAGRRCRPAATLAVIALAALACAPATGGEGRAGAGSARVSPPRWTAGSGERLVGGIAVREPDLGRWIDGLRAAGLDTVALTVYARQGEWDGAELEIGEPAPWIADEARAAKAAGLRVVLVLRVALDHAVERNRFLWHGMIHPSDDETVGRWFARYREFVLRWAVVADEAGIDVLGIGSELGALASTRPVDALPELAAYYLDPVKHAERRARAKRFETEIATRHLHGSWQETYDSLDAYLDDEIEAHRAWAAQVTGHAPGEDPARAVAAINRRRALLRRHWSGLVAAVREVYRGELTYAANFDEYRAVAFWPELDVIGINAYFPLRDRPSGAGDRDGSALEAELEASWRRVLGEIAAFREEVGAAEQPVLFTELGYTRRDGATLEPWVGRGFSLVGDWHQPELVVWDERAHGYEERAAAVRALERAHRALDPELLCGLLWWKLSTVKEHAEIEPFVLLIGENAPPDPLLAELRRFAGGEVRTPTSRR